MKNIAISGLLAAMVFPVGNATTVTGSYLEVGPGNGGVFGSGNSVTYDSVAIGWGSTANQASLAVGSNVLMDANSGGSILVGGEASLEGVYFSAVFGHGNLVVHPLDPLGVEIGADGSLVIAGAGNKVYRAMGQSSTANILFGLGNEIDTTVPGSDEGTSASILIGSENRTSRSEAWMIGKGNIGQTGTLTLGTYAGTIPDAALIVGTGTADNARTNGLIVMKDGIVRIPGGNLMLGLENALTSTSAQTVIGSHLTSGGYLKRAMGGGTAAEGAFGAWGSASVASADDTFAVGSGAAASGYSSLSFGANSVAASDYSVAIGSNSVATAGDSFALLGGKSNGVSSIAAAYAQADGWYSFASGLAKASGDGSLALGGFDLTFLDNGEYGNETSGENSVAIGGFLNSASGLASFASGNWSKATAAYSTVLGSLNKGVSASSTNWIQTDPLFELGNGHVARSLSEPSSASRSNAITTLKNGRTILTNKFWSDTSPDEIPSNASESSNGEALVAEGHTVLRGNAKVEGNTTLVGTVTVTGGTTLSGQVVLTEPQGDISMGVYGE